VAGAIWVSDGAPDRRIWVVRAWLVGGQSKRAGTMIRTIGSAIVTVFIWCAPFACAQDAGGMRAACAADFQKLCANSEPGPGRRQCLLENQDKLSDGCKTALTAMQARATGIHEACAADAQKYCADAVQGQGRMQCMMANTDKFSEACKTALAGMAEGGR